MISLVGRIYKKVTNELIYKTVVTDVGGNKKENLWLPGSKVVGKGKL